MLLPPGIAEELVEDDDRPGYQSVAEEVEHRLGGRVEIRVEGKKVTGPDSSFRNEGKVSSKRPGTNCGSRHFGDGFLSELAHQPAPLRFRKAGEDVETCDGPFNVR